MNTALFGGFYFTCKEVKIVVALMSDSVKMGYRNKTTER
jgi:hypothetical protein